MRRTQSPRRRRRLDGRPPARWRLGPTEGGRVDIHCPLLPLARSDRRAAAAWEKYEDSSSSFSTLPMQCSTTRRTYVCPPMHPSSWPPSPAPLRPPEYFWNPRARRRRRRPNADEDQVVEEIRLRCPGTDGRTDGRVRGGGTMGKGGGGGTGKQKGGRKGRGEGKLCPLLLLPG